MGRSRISEMKIQKIFLKAFLACVASGQFINWKGECKSVPKIKKFNLQKYGGLWYEQLRYPEKVLILKNFKGNISLINIST